MCPERVKTITDWLPPTTLTELRSFLGFANFYRSFIPNYASITTPLTDLTKKDKSWCWTPTHQLAFDDVKTAFVTADVVRHFDPSLPTTLETDASDFAISGIVSQKFTDGVHPIAFFSRKLQPAELNYDTHDKELLAIIDSMSAFRHFLQGNTPFDVFTDHRNLQYFTTTKPLNRRQVRWSHFLVDFNFLLHHRPGSLNKVADAASRRAQDSINASDAAGQKRILLPQQLLVPVTSEHFALICAHEPITPHLLLEEQIRLHCKTDRFYLDTANWMINPKSKWPPGYRLGLSKKINTIIHSADSTNTTVQPPPPTNQPRSDTIDESNFTLHFVDGLLYHNDQIYIPEALQVSILSSRHDSPAAGHFGHTKTIHGVARHFWWPSLIADVKHYVDSCETCARAKSDQRKPAGLLKPLPVPSGRWTHVSLDHIMGLKEVNGFNTILVVVDRYTKMAHFIPASSSDTSADTARRYIQNVWKLHGAPEQIISDRRPLFAAEFWQSFWSRFGTASDMSTAFHPETDGQTERVNSVTAQYLRLYINHQHDNWPDLLASAEFAYNNAIHSTIGTSPFYANNGYEPRHDSIPARTVADKPSDLASAMALIDEHLRSALTVARTTMSTNADKHRQPAPSYNVGNMVYLIFTVWYHLSNSADGGQDHIKF